MAVTITFVVLLMFFVMIVFHEYGHMVAAKHFGLKVPVFAVGFGTKVFSLKGKDRTEYRYNMIPFGGFCDIDDNDLYHLPAWKHISVLAAGVFNNLLLGILLIEASQLVYGVNDLKNYLTIPISGFVWVLDVLKGALGSIFDISSFVTSGGPIAGMAELASTVTMFDQPKMVWSTVLFICGLLSYSVAIFNILPIPALDGGQILFRLVDEAVYATTKKRVNQKVFQRINSVFFVALMLLQTAYFGCDLLLLFQ